MLLSDLHVLYSHCWETNSNHNKPNTVADNGRGRVNLCVQFKSLQQQQFCSDKTPPAFSKESPLTRTKKKHFKLSKKLLCSLTSSKLSQINQAATAEWTVVPIRVVTFYTKFKYQSELGALKFEILFKFPSSTLSIIHQRALSALKILNLINHKVTMDKSQLPRWDRTVNLD